MKTEEIARRLRLKARQDCPPEFPPERLLVWVAADALEAQAREIESTRRALEDMFPADDGFTEAFDGLVSHGLLVEVPADDLFRALWGEDEETMWTWRWRATPEETEGHE